MKTSFSIKRKVSFVLSLAILVAVLLCTAIGVYAADKASLNANGKAAQRTLLAGEEHTHCICGDGKAAGMNNHVCADVTWTSWDSTTALPTEAGCYYLTADISLSATHYVNLNGGTIYICLNGKTVKRGGRVISDNSGSKSNMVICDCVGTGKIRTSASSASTDGGVFWMNKSGSTLTLYSGTVDASNLSMTGNARGGAIDMGNSQTTLNIYNATVKGCKAATFNSESTIRGHCSGGAIYTVGTVNMYGGTVTGGKTLYGGSVAVYSASDTISTKGNFNMYGGTVTGGTAANSDDTSSTVASGGCICVMKNAIFNMYGGTVTGGTANGFGGNIYVKGGTAYMNGGTVTSGTTLYYYYYVDSVQKHAGGHSGNIYVTDAGTYTMDDGTISNGKAVFGGNLALTSKGSTFTMNGGVIKDGINSSSSYTYGCNIYMTSSTGCCFNFNGGEIGMTAAGAQTGHIALMNGIFAISGNPKVTSGYIEIRTAGLTLQLGTIGDSAVLPILADKDGAITEATDEANLEKIYCPNTNKQLVYKDGAIYQEVVPLTNTTHPLYGKRILVCGNSFTQNGRCVQPVGASANLETRSHDDGYLYQLFASQGIDVDITNFTFGAHQSPEYFASLFGDTCTNSSGNCKSADHYAVLGDDKAFDIIIFQLDRDYNQPDVIATYIKEFRKYNPNAKFYITLPEHSYSCYEFHGADAEYTKLYYSARESIKAVEALGVSVIDWGGLVHGIYYDKTLTVENAQYTYNKQTFVVATSASDGYHENPLAGYITALCIYRELTGESVQGLPYEFTGNAAISANFNLVEYYASHYKLASSNFMDILQSEQDMLGIQKLVDTFIPTSTSYRSLAEGVTGNGFVDFYLIDGNGKVITVANASTKAALTAGMKVYRMYSAAEKKAVNDAILAAGGTMTYEQLLSSYVAAPQGLQVVSTTDTSVTVTQYQNAEYSLDGTTWQDSNTLTGLTAGVEYTVYARYKETDTSFAGTAATVTVTLTNKTAAVVNIGGEDTEYASLQAAVAAITAASADNAPEKLAIIRLADNVTESFTVAEGHSVCFDLNGYQLGGTVTLDVGQFVYIINSATDLYEDADGYCTFTAEGGSIYTGAFKASNKKRYFVSESEAGKLQSSRFYIGVTHMYFGTIKMGAGYKAQIAGNSEILNNIADIDDEKGAFGMKFSVPTASDKVIYIGAAADKFTTGAEHWSATYQVNNIMSKSVDAAANAQRAQTAIVAQVYINFTGSDEPLESAEYTFTLKNMVEAADGQFSTMSTSDQAALKQMYKTWGTEMEEWSLPNIKAAQQ